MNFQGLQKIENVDKYIDRAFKASKQRNEKKLGGDKTAKIKYMEIDKIEKFNKVLSNILWQILKSFPNIDDLPEFYVELIKTTLDYVKLKKALGTINWCTQKLSDLKYNVTKGLKKAPTVEIIKREAKGYYGRATSFFKQCEKSLKYLEECRKIMKSYPNVKTSIKTVCICGFPNVGKTTLLTKITSADPEINSYAFTTKRLNMGYFKVKGTKIQVIDTPGTLNRFNKMNDIEKQAYLAIKYCADLIIYVFDLTEPFSLEDQEKLYKELKKYNKEIMFYLSKTDIVDDKEVKEFTKKYNIITDNEELKKLIYKRLREVEK